MLLNFHGQLPPSFFCVQVAREFEDRQLATSRRIAIRAPERFGGCLEDHHIETCVVYVLFYGFYSGKSLFVHPPSGETFLCFPTTITSKYRCLVSRYAPWWSVGPLTLSLPKSSNKYYLVMRCEFEPCNGLSPREVWKGPNTDIDPHVRYDWKTRVSRVRLPNGATWRKKTWGRGVDPNHVSKSRMILQVWAEDPAEGWEKSFIGSTTPTQDARHQQDYFMLSRKTQQMLVTYFVAVGYKYLV